MIKLLILSLITISCNSETFSEKVNTEYKKLTPQVFECKKEIDNIAKSIVDRSTYTDNYGYYFKTIDISLEEAIKKLAQLNLKKLNLNDEWKFNQLLIKECSVENFKFFFSYLKESNFCSGALFELLAYYRALGSDLVEKEGTVDQIRVYTEKLLEQTRNITTKDSSFLEQLIALNFLQTLHDMKLIGTKHGGKIQAMVKKYDSISGTLGKKRLYSLVNMNEKQMGEVCTTFSKLFETESTYAKEVASQLNLILDDIKKEVPLSKDYVWKKINSAKYCKTKNDCVAIPADCPFGCNTFVNKKELAGIMRILKEYFSYEQSCIYACEQMKIDCIKSKCETF